MLQGKQYSLQQSMALIGALQWHNVHCNGLKENCYFTNIKEKLASLRNTTNMGLNRLNNLKQVMNF